MASLRFGAVQVGCALVLGSISIQPAHAQLGSAPAFEEELGRPFMTCYAPQETGGHLQSWAFEQDDRGVLYVGNGLGLLEFDGSAWRLIKTPNRQFVRSLDMDAERRLYVGSAAEFGYLAPDSLGRMQYVSLLSHIPPEDRDFSYVWTTHATPEGVYFQSHDHIYRFRPNGEAWDIRKWTPTGQFAYAFWLQDTLYVNQGGVGLMKMVNDSLQLLPGGEQFAGDRIHVLLPMEEGPERGGKGKLIVGTFTRGLFLYDGSRIVPWSTEASEFVRESTPYAAEVLPDGNYGIGLLTGGLIIMTPDGRVVRKIDQSSGLPSGSILSISRDREGGIWIAPENGICRVETPSPLSIFDASLGIAEIAYDLVRYDGALYAATTNGVLVLESGTGRFQPIEGLPGGNRQAWSFAAMDDELLVAVGEGVYQIDGGQASAIRPNEDGLTYSALYLHRSKLNPNRLFVGLFDGLATLLRQPDGTWLDEGRVPGTEGYVLRIMEQDPGVLWIARGQGFPLRVTFTDDGPLPDTIETIGSNHGLAHNTGGTLYRAAGGIFFVDQTGLYRHDASLDYFGPDTLLGSVGHREKIEYFITDDAHGNVWANFGQETAFFRKTPGGTYQNEPTAALRFFDDPAVSIYPEKNGVVWFATAHGVIRFDTNLQEDNATPFTAMVRQVVAGDDEIPLGVAEGKRAGAAALMPRLGPDRNSMRFTYAAPSLDRPRETQYRSMLDGFDETWSSWSKEGSRVYTNLPFGDYTFRVRARNIYGVESSEAAYSFAILAPWYRSWLAYFLYLLAAGAGVWMVVRLRTGQLQARGRELEVVVAQRTHELLAQKENVEVLSRIGRDITASLDFDTIFQRLYENVNRLLDATIFGVGVYHPDREVIEYRLAVERGKRYAPYTRDMNNKNQLPVWCIEHREPVFIRDYEREYAQYIDESESEHRLLEDGTVSESPRSLMYLPLTAKDRVLGVLTVQSFETNAYSDYDMSILRTLAAYTSVALDNAYAYDRLNETLEHLRSVQQQLIHQEKLASLGSMTAGIAHEIKNPLNFVNNFAALSVEMVDEIEEELRVLVHHADEETAARLKATLADLRLNCGKIEEHGRRANGIVKSMLEHSRGTAADRRDVDINALVDEYLNLAFHGMRAHHVDFNCTLEREVESESANCEIAPQEIGRVLINLLNNAFYAVDERRQRAEGDYRPTVRATTRSTRGGVEIIIWDNGGGIPPGIREHIFEPFYTTKPTGEGTGLGLSLSYEIVTQGHGGHLDVTCEDGESTEFRLFLPRTNDRVATVAPTADVVASAGV